MAGRNDLKTFTELMGYNEQEGRKNGKFQEEWYEFLQRKFSPLKEHPDWIKRFLLLWPRGHAKTECTSINYVSWLIGNYPDIHVNIVTKTASLAEEILTAIMTRIENDERYIEIFGELKPEITRRWTSHEIIIKRKEISKNATVKASGLLGPITGGRSDLIICDDIIDEENIRTRLQIAKVQLWFNKVLYPTLYPWGAIIVIGTRWSYNDLYTDLLQTWPHDIKRSILVDEKGQLTTQTLWSEYWTLEGLEKRRKQIGTIFFQTQYQNDPTGMQGDLLRSEWLQSWQQDPPALPKYAGVDPALGEGDLQGIATLSYDRFTKQAYLEDVYAERTGFPAFLQKIQSLHAEHHYVKIYIESNAFQKALTFIEELRGLPIVPTVTSHDKEQRFITMSSHFESGRVLVNPMLNVNSEFWTEWVQFPRGQNDDALDAVEIVTRNVIGAKGDIHAWRLG
jgi:predicted phage terminase large subunit-like protein